MKVTLKWIVVCSGADLSEYQKELEDAKGGIYLWIWGGNSRRRRVVYIGETDNFITRSAQHFCNVLGGLGTYFRHIAKDDDFVEIVRKHYAGKSLEELRSGSAVYIPDKPEKIKLCDCLPSKNELMARWQYLRGMDYAFAEIDPPVSRDVRREIEGGLIRDIWAHYCLLACGEAGYEQDPLNRKRARKNQKLIGNINKHPTKDYEIEHAGHTKRIPQEMLEIRKIESLNKVADSRT